MLSKLLRMTFAMHLLAMLIELNRSVIIFLTSIMVPSCSSSKFIYQS